MKPIRTMKTSIALLVAALLVVGGAALAQTGGPDLRYTIQAGTVAGGGYQLTALHWQVSGTTGGGGYSLTTGADRAGGGNQCCCTYLPVILRNK